MDQDLNFRPATPDDADALARVHVDAWRKAYHGLVPDSYLDGMDYNSRAAEFRASLSTHSEETYVVELQGDVVGFLTIGTCRDDDVDPHATSEIWGLYLAPHVWRRGIGRFLLHQAIQMLSSRHFTQTVLWVFEENDRANRFYEAMGFVRDGVSKILNAATSLRAIRYRRELAPDDPTERPATKRKSRPNWHQESSLRVLTPGRSRRP
jgi:ribosomal protein S18 acetylase RimI-like enzyme